MTPIIDNWVLIADEDNYTIARYLGKRVDKKGNVQNILKNPKYYTTLSGSFNGLRAQMEREILSQDFPGVEQAFKAVLESNKRLSGEFGRIMNVLGGKE